MFSSQALIKEHDEIIIKTTVVVSVVGEKLYVVMELIEGVPLTQHFNSLKEKQQQFTEDRIWNIFIQVPVLFLHQL